MPRRLCSGNFGPRSRLLRNLWFYSHHYPGDWLFRMVFLKGLGVLGGLNESRVVFTVSFFKVGLVLGRWGPLEVLRVPFPRRYLLMRGTRELFSLLRQLGLRLINVNYYGGIKVVSWMLLSALACSEYIWNLVLWSSVVKWLSEVIV